MITPEVESMYHCLEHWTSLKDQGDLLPRLTDTLLCQNVFSPWILLITLPLFQGIFPEKAGLYLLSINSWATGTGHSLNKTTDGAIPSFDMDWMDLVTCLSWMECSRSDSLWLPGLVSQRATQLLVILLESSLSYLDWSFLKHNHQAGRSPHHLKKSFVGALVESASWIHFLGHVSSDTKLWVKTSLDDSVLWPLKPSQLRLLEQRKDIPWPVSFYATRGTGNTGSIQKAECTDLLINRGGILPYDPMMHMAEDFAKWD